MRKKREEKYTTIIDVAKKAGVSIATVSRVINDGTVSEKKRKLVLDTIKELNYVPNNSARNLASVNTTKRIILMVPTIEYRCYTELIKGFKKGASLYKYDPAIQEYDFDVLEYQAMQDMMEKSSEIKGIVQIGEHIPSERKVITDLKDELLKFELGERFVGKKCGIYFDKDDYLSRFFNKHIFSTKNSVEVSMVNFDDTCDFYVTQTTEQAMRLINRGVTKEIFILEDCTQLSKVVTNISRLPIDFYMVGVGLSRIIIKRLSALVTEDEQSLVIKID